MNIMIHINNKEREALKDKQETVKEYKKNCYKKLKQDIYCTQWQTKDGTPKFLKFGEINNENNQFHILKKPIKINEVNIVKILVKQFDNFHKEFID